MKLCYKCMTYREIEEFKFTEDDPLRQVCNVCKANTVNDEKDKDNGEQE